MTEPEPPVSLLRVVELIVAVLLLVILVGPWLYAHVVGLLGKVWLG